MISSNGPHANVMTLRSNMPLRSRSQPLLYGRSISRHEADVGSRQAIFTKCRHRSSRITLNNDRIIVTTIAKRFLDIRRAADAYQDFSKATKSFTCALPPALIYRTRRRHRISREAEADFQRTSIYSSSWCARLHYYTIMTISAEGKIFHRLH